MSRPSCLDCGRKHIAEAEVLMREAVMGYVGHEWLSIGHMSQAEAELLQKFPEMAHTIRAERINYIDGLEYQILKEDDGSEYLSLEAKYEVDTLGLIKQLTILEVKDKDGSDK